MNGEAHLLSGHLAPLLETEERVEGLEHGFEDDGELLQVGAVQPSGSVQEKQGARGCGPEPGRVVRGGLFQAGPDPVEVLDQVQVERRLAGPDQGVEEFR